MRNEKGVSLITLIITIIVVIILAVIILRSGASDTPDQAQFSGFTSEMGDLQDAVKAAMLEAKGTENIRGNNRTDAQLYNFVARGGYDALPEDASGDAQWLIQSDAKTIPCTLINADYAEESIGTELPVRKVETEKGTKQELSYFVTPKGNVFCWPPYVYDGKSYVTANLTVKDENGKEYKDVEATAAATVTIEFSNGEKVLVSNEDATDADAEVAFKRDMGNTVSGDSTASVWYTEDVRDGAVQSHRGVAAGYEFSEYFNNKD